MALCGSLVAGASGKHGLGQAGHWQAGRHAEASTLVGVLGWLHIRKWQLLIHSCLPLLPSFIAHWGSPFINSQGMKQGKSLKGFIWTEVKP